MTTQRSKATCALALAFLLDLACAAPLATQGLLEDDDAAATLAPPGELGMSSLSLRSMETRLPSGMRLLIEDAPTRGMVAVVLSIGAGATSDPPGKEGLAHLVEHLSFAADSHLEGISVASALVATGAVFNADTAMDTTRFHEQAPMAALPQLLELAARRLSQPLSGVDDSDVELERQVIANELRQRDENGVFGQALGWMQAALLPAGHAYARSVGGSISTVGPLTLADARAFAAQHYHPNNASLVIVGEFKDTDVKALVAKQLPEFLSNHLEPPPSAPPAKAIPPSALPPGPKDDRVHKVAVALPEAWLGWVLPGSYSATGSSLVQLMTASVVEEELRARLPLDAVPEVEVLVVRARLATFVICRIVVSDVSLREAAIERVTAEMTGFWQPASTTDIADVVNNVLGEVDQSRVRLGLREAWGKQVAGLQRQHLIGLRQRALADIIFANEGFAARALSRSDYLQFIGRGAGLEDTLAHASSAKTDEVARLAARYFKPDRTRVVRLDPLPAGDRPAPGPTGVPGARREISDHPFDATQFPRPAWAPPPREVANARLVRLPNGLDVVIMRRPHFGAVSVALGFRGGAASAPPGVVELIRWLETSNPVSSALNAVKVTPHDQPDFTLDLVRTGADNLGNALMLLATNLVRTDAFDWEKALEPAQKPQSKSPSEVAVNPLFKQLNMLVSALYGDHRYAHSPFPTDAAMTAKQVRQSLLQLRNPKNGFLVVAGDVDVDRAEKLVAAWLGNWKRRDDVAVPLVPPVPRPGLAVPPLRMLYTPRPGTAQTDIKVACRLPSGPGKIHQTNRLLARILGSYLVTRLRAETGATYGMTSEAQSFSGNASHLILTSAVDNERLAETLRSLRGHWKAFADNGFDEGALSQIVWAESARLNVRYQTSAELALEVAPLVARGLGVDSIVREPIDLAAVTTQDLRSAFATCLQHTVVSLLGEPRLMAQAAQSAGFP